MYLSMDGTLGSMAPAHVIPAEAIGGALAEGGFRGYPGAEEWLSPMASFLVLERLQDPDEAAELDAESCPEWLRPAIRRAAIRSAKSCGRRIRTKEIYSADHIQAGAAEMLKALRAADDPERHHDSALKLRRSLLEALAAGTVRAWGVPGDAPPGANHKPIPGSEFAGPVHLLPATLRSALAHQDTPDLWRVVMVNRAEAMAVLRAAVKAMRREEEGPSPVPQQPPRRPRGRSYRAADAPLVAKMHALLKAGEARNATDAARAVVGEATGKGTAEAKVKRLREAYQRTHPAESDPAG